MVNTKKRRQSGGGGVGGDGSGGGGGLTSKKIKQRPGNTNKQSAKQRIRAEAAERSRLSRKANQALERRLGREEAATPPADAAGDGGTPHPTPPSRAERREAVQQDVEARLSTWRRKRALAEAGLPEDAAGDFDGDGNHRSRPSFGRRSEPAGGQSSFFPNGYYPEQAGYGGGGGRGGGGGGGGAFGSLSSADRVGTTTEGFPPWASGLGSSLGGGRKSGVGRCWPDVYNAPVRRCLPGSARGALLRGGGNAPGDPSEEGRDAEEHWEAPWMVGLVNRGRTRHLAPLPLPDGAGARAGCGTGSPGEPVDLVSSEGEDDQGEQRMVVRGRATASEDGRNGTAPAANVAGPPSNGGAARGGARRYREHSIGDGSGGGRSSERGDWRETAGGDRQSSEEREGRRGGREGEEEEEEEEDVLSDLHHEIIKFEEYVSLTPSEVAARESLVAAIQASAGEALGLGATARAFGSYGGMRTTAENCFSIFLSDVDISVRPPVDPGALPPAAEPHSRSQVRPPHTRPHFLDLSRGSVGGFEEGSSSSVSSSSSSSSSESSSSESSESSSDDSDSSSNGPLELVRRRNPAAAANARTAAAEVVDITSSGSEIDDADRLHAAASRERSQERSLPEYRATASCPPDAAAAAAAAAAAIHQPTAPASTVTEISTSPEPRANPSSPPPPQPPQQQQADQGGDQTRPPTGPATAGGDGVGEGARELEAGASAEVLGFYMDCTPDPALLKVAAQEREVAAARERGPGKTGGSRRKRGRGAEESDRDGVAEKVGRKKAKAAHELAIRDPAAAAAAAMSMRPAEATPSAGSGTGAAPGPRGGGAAVAERTSGSSSSSSSSLSSSSSSSASVPASATGKGKKRPRSPESEVRGGGGGRGNGGGDGRLRAVFKPDGGGWAFVTDTGHNSTDAVKDEGKGVELEGGGGGVGGGDDAKTVRKDGSSGSGGDAAVAGLSAIFDLHAAASGAGYETAAQLASRVRAESERTARLTEDAATLAAKLSPAFPLGGTARKAGKRLREHGGGSIGCTEEATMSLAGGAAAAAATGKDGGSEEDCGAGAGAVEDEKQPKTNRGDGEDEEGEEEEKREEARHADGLMALVREQERRNRGGSLPSAFLGGNEPDEAVPPTGSDGGTRAARLQAALTVAAVAAAKRRKLSAGGAADSPREGGYVETHTHQELVDERRSGVATVWRGGKAGGKARAVSGLRKLGKRLLKMPWVEKFEFRSRAKVPIIAMLDARVGVDCDVGWGGDGEAGDCWDDPADAPGPVYFAEMFPGTFRPLALFLKVFLHQRGLDKPFTGGLGSFKLYALIASHLQACGCGRRAQQQQQQQQQRDLGDLLLSFLHRYSSESREGITPTTVLRIKGLTVDLGSSFRALAASKDFGRAFQALSSAAAEEATRSSGGGGGSGSRSSGFLPGQTGQRSDASRGSGGKPESGTHKGHRERDENGKGKKSGGGGGGGGGGRICSDSQSHTSLNQDQRRNSQHGARRSESLPRPQQQHRSTTDGGPGPRDNLSDWRDRQPEHGDRQDRRWRRQRSSILGRVIWGSDLRRERESRLAAVGSTRTSPEPTCAEPAWHVKLEATSHPDGGARPETFWRAAATPWGHRSNTAGHGSGRVHAGNGGGLLGARWGARGRGGGGVDRYQAQQRPSQEQPQRERRTKAQRKRAKLKRDAEEIAKRKRKRANNGKELAACGGGGTTRAGGQGKGKASSPHGLLPRKKKAKKTKPQGGPEVAVAAPGGGKAKKWRPTASRRRRERNE